MKPVASVTTDGRTDRTLWPHLCAIGVAGLALALVLLHGEPNEWGGDNTTFLVLAEALARGYGYVDLHLATPVPHTRYPPLFPLLLAPWVGLGAPLLVIKAFVASLSVAGVGLAYVYLRRIVPPTTALLACLGTLTSGVFLDAGFSVMSDGPYLLLSFAAMLVVDSALRCGTTSWSSCLVAGLLIGLAVLTRTAGLTLLPALAGAALVGASAAGLGARMRRGVFIGAVAVLVIGAWHGRGLLGLAPSPGDGTTLEQVAGSPTIVPPAESVIPTDTLAGYVAEFGKRADGGGEGLDGISGGGRTLLDRPWLNVKDLWSRAWYSMLPAFVERAGPGAVWWTRRVLMGMLLAFGAVSALGLLRGALLRRRFGDAYGLVYCLMLLFWVGGGPRLLLPILPLLIMWMVEGLALVVRGVARLLRASDPRASGARVELLALALVLVLDLLVTFGTDHMRSRLSGSQDRWWGRFLQAVDHAAEVLPRDAVLITAPATLPYQRRGLRTTYMPNVRTHGATRNLRLLLESGADALLLDPFLDYHAAHRYHQLYERFPEHFERLTGEADVVLLRVLPEPGGA